MRRVTSGNVLYAFVLSKDDFEPGTKFISEPDWPLQVGLMSLPSGHSIAAHAHLVQDHVSINRTQEFLWVVSGRMEVRFFDDLGKCFHEEILVEGEVLFHICGGHAFRFLEPTRLIEVKSGPYRGRDKDKVLIAVDASTLPADSKSSKRTTPPSVKHVPSAVEPE